VTNRTLTLGDHTYPVILPNVRDARLHVAAVIITIHVLGQVRLRFQVSVPQILAAVLTCAILEVALTFYKRRSFVWPASAMLTGSGVALILRIPGTPLNDHWSTHAWWAFAGVAGFSLMTKYVVRYRGSHVFNPSNIGLVIAFIVFGSARMEPLDFWWAPLKTWMILAYVVIVVGGVLISARLRLLAAVASFWLALAAGLGVLAASGHCMTARWAFAPVCGFDYWRVIVTSPEVFIFMFFMITDPKTLPAGRVGRVVFGLLVAVVSTLLMAAQTQEFWTKVALLGGLVIVCGGRPILERFTPEPRSAADNPRRFAARLAAGGGVDVGILRRVLRVGLVGSTVLVVAVGIVAAGAPARGVIVADAAEVLGRLPHDVDPSTFPAISVEQGVLDWNHEIAGPVAQQLVLTLAENLEFENQALLESDAPILEAVDHGDRLDEMMDRLRDSEATGEIVIERYQIDQVNVTLLVPFGKQDGLSLGLESVGTVTSETYDVAGHLQSRTSSPFATTFAIRRATGGRWLNVAVLPTDVSRQGRSALVQRNLPG
jgi:Na+-translocating ferredoxin:NAD+ oxidoreductase RnfD subunit